MSTDPMNGETETETEPELDLPVGLDPIACQEVLDYLKRSRGFDFGGYKPATLYRRLQKRMEMVNITSCSEYLDYLEVHPDEFPQLFNTILINVTSFFRDPSSWETLEQTFIPLMRAAGPDTPFRIWSAGCASGEEPYTIMMMLAEHLGMDAVRQRVKLYATDIDDEALQEARMATYSARDVAGIPEHLLAKYFRQSGPNYVFSSDLRRNVIFGKHDLMNDAPISRVDLLTCRNTLMYFNSEVQSRILSRFHFALRPNGLIMLGKAEMLFSHSSLFAPLDLKRRIFTKVPQEQLKDRVLLMMQGYVSDGDSPEIEGKPLSKKSEWLSVFDAVPQAQIVVDSTGIITVINRDARQQFRLTVGDVGRPLHELEISYRPVELRSLIDKAYRDKQAVMVKDASYALGANRKSETGYLDVQVAPIFGEDGAPIAALISFNEMSSYKLLRDELQEANRALETAYEELQSTNEELETTNEELQSTIEELETTNEELQSTNEELETMNEELQSTIEELETTNEELRLRSLDLNKVNTFMTAILSGLNAGVAVLDKEMVVQIWSDKAEDLWGVRSEESVGRHLLTLDIGLPLEQVKADIRSVIAGEANFREVKLNATNRRGRQVECKVSVSRLIGDLESPEGVLMLMEQVSPA